MDVPQLVNAEATEVALLFHGQCLNCQKENKHVKFLKNSVYAIGLSCIHFQFTLLLRKWCSTMASLADSKAHFLARAREYSVPEDLIDNMRVAGVSTMAHLAFAFVRPGQDFEEEKFDA